ncbi:hypothetical protein [Aliikangiella sp. G2MR2-5]|uniref:hypothetical protein n=1 Tax=Aliikangiella sp. G2MR2-5 TaxID=2788943 RepID=UPI0018A893DB|nr:hypothetical protein [Aliikangiella sp. G2MR2-5]
MNLRLVSFILLFMLSNAEAVNYRDGSITYLYGDNFAVEPEEQQTLTFEYVAAWDNFSFFMFIDAKDYKDGGDSRYGEFSPRYNLSDYGKQGLVNKLYLAATLERGSSDVSSNLFGFGVDLNSEFFNFANLTLYQRNDPDVPDYGYQLTGVWSFDTQIGEVPLTIDGFFDWTFANDEGADNLHFNPQIKLDMKKWFGGNTKWYLGIEYDFWSNKFAIEDTAGFDTDQNTWSFLAKWHF